MTRKDLHDLRCRRRVARSRFAPAALLAQPPRRRARRAQRSAARRPPSNKRRRTRTRTGRRRGRLGATRTCKALGAPTTCAVFRASGRKLSARRSRCRRSSSSSAPTTQQTGRTRAATTETFLRNEWGTRTFGFTSLVVDPPNGRTPPLNDAGRARQAASAGRGTFSSTKFDSFDDFSYYDRCIGLGINRGMGAAIYGNGIRIFQSPDAVTITYEMIHETRVIKLDRDRPYIARAAVHRQRARLLRRRHARRRDARLHRQIERRRRPEQRQHGHDGAHSPRRSRDDRVPHHDQRSGYVHGAVHGAHDVDHAAELLRVRVLLPRRQLRGRRAAWRANVRSSGR